MPFEVGATSTIDAGRGVRAAGAVEQVTTRDFEEKVLRARGPVAVEFMTYACGHCRRAEPMVRDVAAALGQDVKIYQVNVPMEPDLVRRYGIQYTPTFVMFQSGREVGRANPNITAFDIRNAITSAFER
jgi:thioredoxin 1